MKRPFGGIIEEGRRLKDLGYSPIIHASHSNAKAICDVPRNLTDEQIKVIAKEFNGTIGIVEYKIFVKNGGVISKLDPHYYEKYYLKHINHLRDILGGIENISVSTDDMMLNFVAGDKPPVYKHKEVANKIRELLRDNGYNKKDIENILYKNFEEKILSRL